MKKPTPLNRWPLLIAAAAILMVLVSQPPGSRAAAIYVCKGKGGGEHFTNVPESDQCVVYHGKSSSPFAPAHRRTGRGTARSDSFSLPVPYNSHITHCGARYDVDPNLIKAVIRTESDFNRYAVSRRGAQGLMQLMPDTARELNVADPFDPRQNIDGGTRYLRTLLDIFNGDLPLTLAAYNAGPTLVKRIQRVPRIPETVDYVRRVLACYQGYQGGEGMALLQNSTIKVREIVTIQ